MKNRKNILTILLIIFIIGAIMAVSGFIMGGVNPIIINSNGFKVYNTKDLVEVKEDLSSFKDIEITSSISDVNIISSDKFSIEIASPKDFGAVKYSVQDDKLTVTQENTSSGIHINLGAYNNKNSYINLYVPSDIIFNSLNLKSNSANLNIKEINANDISIIFDYGDLNIETAKANTFKCLMNSGDLDITNLTVINNSTIENQYGDIEITNSNINTLTTNLNSGTIKINESKIEATTIENKYGDVKANNLISNGLNISADSGDVNLVGELNGTTIINVLYGEVNINTSLKEEEYNYSSITKYGDVRVDNISYERNISKNNNAKNNIDASAQSGDIKIFFSK